MPGPRLGISANETPVPSRFAAGPLVLAGLSPADARAITPAEFTNWPAGASPVEVGRRVADNFVTRSFGWQSDPKARQETKSDDLEVQYDYYLARPRRIGDLHGQAPLLWTAAAFLR